MRHVQPLILLAGAAVLLALAVLLTLWLRRRRKGRRRARKPRKALRYPVVLAHGAMGFDALEVGSMRQEYFRGVSPHLLGRGEKVHTVRVSALGAVEVRAKQLAQAVKAIDAKRVNIIAHSMGGLDARYAISQLGLASRVASLTTIGTPHGGTPIADLGTGIGSILGLKKALDVLGIDVNALYDVTTARMTAFNREVTDVKGVTYCSVIASISGLSQMNPLLMATYLFLSERVGDNDGIVPSQSQSWGEVLRRIDADHWAQIGWSTRFDAPQFYAKLIEDLRERGF